MPQLPLTLRDPVVRSSALALLLTGTGASMAFPLLTLFSVEDLGYRPSVASLFFLTSLVGPLVSVATGRLSDRLASRYPLILATTLWLAAGWLLLSFAQSLWVVLLVGVVFFGFIGTLGAQVFAQLRDYLTANGFERQNQLVASVRTAYAAGWIVGPVVGNWVDLTLGPRELFVFTAALYLCSQVPLLALCTLRKAAPGSHPQLSGEGRSAAPVFVFAGLCALAMSGDTLKLSFLPIYMRAQLEVPAWLQGAVISTQPLLELVLIPAMGIMADRFGAARLLIVGATAGVVGNVFFALGGGVWTLFAGQVFVSVLVASVLGLGVTAAQDLYPGGVGYASSIYFSGLGLSAALGGLLRSAGAAWLGLPGVLAVPAFACGLVGLGFYLMHKVRPADRSDLEALGNVTDGG